VATLVVGSGLVGSQIARIELERGERVVVFDISPQIEALNDVFPVEKATIVRGDVLKFEEVKSVLRREEVDHVYHTAAYPGFTIGSQSNPHAAVELNIMGFMNVLEAARMEDVRTLVFTSSNVLSTYVRPPKDGGSRNKEYAYPRPTSIYASTKLAAENFGLNYADSYGLDFVAVRLAAVFGPWRSGGGGGPTTLMREMILKAIRGERFVVDFGEFEYIYSKDAGRGATLACHSDRRRDRIFNIGTGKIYPLREIARMIKEAVPTAAIEVSKRTPESSSTKPATGLQYVRMPRPDFEQALDLTRSKEQLGYEPMYPMEIAIREYAEFLGRMEQPAQDS
jgi:nucleoside-diphosphate-sugar epimerase